MADNFPVGVSPPPNSVNGEGSAFDLPRQNPGEVGDVSEHEQSTLRPVAVEAQRGGSELKSASRTDAASIAALVTTTAYVLLMCVLIFNSTHNEIEWSRAIWLLKGIEVIAFAAAGYLFGRTIQRQETIEAQVDRRKAEAETDKIRAAIENAHAAIISSENQIQYSRESSKLSRPAKIIEAEAILRTALSIVPNKR